VAKLAATAKLIDSARADVMDNKPIIRSKWSLQRLWRFKAITRSYNYRYITLYITTIIMVSAVKNSQGYGVITDYLLIPELALQ